MDTISLLFQGTTPGIVVALLCAGVFIGLLAGTFGVGGGAIAVPVFFETFRTMAVPDAVAMPLAVGTSLAMIVPTSFVSARQHARKGTLDVEILRAWIVPVFGGVVLGSMIARWADPKVFQIVFVCVAGYNAFRMLSGAGVAVLRDTMPTGPLMWAYGGINGLLSSLMGVGGGVISNLILTMNGKSMREAVSTSAGVGALIAIPGSVGYILAGLGKPGLPPGATGFVLWTALALTLPTALIATRLGVYVAHGIGQTTLRRLFGAFLLIASVRFLFEIFS